jgi:hypothetical protein
MQIKKVLRQKPYVEFSSIKKPVDVGAFKILPFSSHTHLPSFVQLFKTILEVTMHNFC